MLLLRQSLEQALLLPSRKGRVEEGIRRKEADAAVADDRRQVDQRLTELVNLCAMHQP